MTEDAGERAGLGDGLAECAVGVGSDDGTIRIAVVGDVPVAVIERDIGNSIDGEVDESTDTSGVLERAGQILAPVVESLVRHRA